MSSRELEHELVLLQQPETRITHFPMVTGLPGITPKEKNGAKANELQQLSLGKDGQPMAGFLGIDRGQKAVKLVFTARKNDVMCVPVLEFKLGKKGYTTQGADEIDIYNLHDKSLALPYNETALEEFYQAVETVRQDYAAKNDATVVDVAIAVDQAGSRLLTKGKIDPDYKAAAEPAMTTVFTTATVVSRAEPAGKAGLQRATVWLLRQSDEKKAAVAAALADGVMVLWSGRILSAINKSMLKGSEFNDALNEDRLLYLDVKKASYAQCEPTSINFVKAVMDEARQAKPGTLIVVEPGSGNPGWVTTYRTRDPRFVSWEAGDAKKHAAAMLAGDAQLAANHFGVKVIEEGHNTEMATALAIGTETMHTAATETAKNSYDEFIKLGMLTPLDKATINEHLSFYQDVRKLAPAKAPQQGNGHDRHFSLTPDRAVPIDAAEGEDGASKDRNEQDQGYNESKVGEAAGAGITAEQVAIRELLTTLTTELTAIKLDFPTLDSLIGDAVGKDGTALNKSARDRAADHVLKAINDIDMSSDIANIARATETIRQQVTGDEYNYLFCAHRRRGTLGKTRTHMRIDAALDKKLANKVLHGLLMSNFDVGKYSGELAHTIQNQGVEIANTIVSAANQNRTIRHRGICIFQKSHAQMRIELAADRAETGSHTP
jgi:hypothetical protein